MIEFLHNLWTDQQTFTGFGIFVTAVVMGIYCFRAAANVE